MATNTISILIIAWGTLEIVLFSGVIFGWPSLVYIFKQEHIFSDLCFDEQNNISEFVNATNSAMTSEFDAVYSYNKTDFTGHCAPQDKLFNLIYVLAVVINGVATFPSGIVWDRFGTRVLRIISMVTFIPGLLILITLTEETALFLFPAMILLAFGGYVILLTNFQLGNLSPNKKSMIISLYAGAYDSSAFMLILIKWAYTVGIATKYAFLVMLLLYGIIIVSTFWFMPKYKVPFPLPPNYKLDFSCSNRGKCKESDLKESVSTVVKHESSTKTEENKVFVEKLSLNEEKENNIKNEPLEKPSETCFKKEVTSLLYISDVIWLTLMRLQSWSFVGRLNPTLDRLADGNQQIVSHYTSIYACMQFFGIFLAPLSGRLMDRKKNRKVDPSLKKIESIEVCIASFIIDNTFGLLLAVTMTIPILEVQYVSFVFHVVHRALLYGPNSAFIAQAFSPKNFGKLFGLAMTVSGAVSLVQFPFFVLVQGPLDGDPMLFNIVILILMLIAYCHPIYLLVWCKRQRKEFVKVEKSFEEK